MTVLDMVTLADLWINLSGTLEGTIVNELTLPGELTGRTMDRQFKCELRGSAPQFHVGGDWEAYLHTAVDHVDFIEKGGNGIGQ